MQIGDGSDGVTAVVGSQTFPGRDATLTEQAPDDELPPEVEVSLSAVEQQMMERVKERIRTKLAKKIKIVPDPTRGAAEMRACSLNLLGYGLIKDAIRYGRNVSTEELTRVIRDTAQAVAKAGCSVIALQGVLGKDIESAEQALTLLASVIERSWSVQSESTPRFQVLVGESIDKGSFNAFLINRNLVTLIEQESFVESNLVKFSASEREKFYRGPMAIKISVQGKERAPTKSLTIFNAALEGTYRMRREQTLAERVQVFESMRELVVNHAQQNVTNEIPIYLVSLSLGVDLSDPSLYLLDGRWRLAQFEPGGLCAIASLSRLECTERLAHPQVLFGLFSADVYPQEIQSKIESFRYSFLNAEQKKQGLERLWKPAKQTTELFMFQPDLKYATVGLAPFGHYKTGAEVYRGWEIREPLVVYWTELNW